MTGVAVLAGGVAMAFALLVAYLVSITGVPFAPISLGQAIIEALPGWISVPLIELLQFWAQRLLVLGVLALFLGTGALTGALAPDRRVATWIVIATGAAPWILSVALGQLLAGHRVDLATDLLGATAGAAAFFGSLAFLLSAERVASPASASRRRALLGGVAVAGLLAGGSLALGGTLQAMRAKVEPVRLVVRRLRRREAPEPGNATFDAVPGITPRLTEVRDHYTVDTALVDPRVDAATWALEVTGHVERPYAIRFEDLLEMEAVERPHTLECISNEIGGDLISTAVWTGVPMKDVLARAVPKAGAFDVVMTSVDGYTDSVPIAKALDPDTLVAYLMNGATLPEEHGHPARALIPGIYGMKNVKWLTRIEVVTGDFLGYWMERGWSDVATYNTHVRIDAPRDPARVDAGPIQVAGIAFAGSRGTRRVEVSTDGGTTWADAVLERAPGRHTWIRWRLEWAAPGPGRYRLLARATDGEGLVQTPVRRPPFPSGSTGYHMVEVTVQRV
jgi:DMSO/TMAO reductase YedYZ molybdopterin-dependent catalytic subunit